MIAVTGGGRFFGHSKEVADAHYSTPLPDETKKAALAFDAALAAR